MPSPLATPMCCNRQPSPTPPHPPIPCAQLLNVARSTRGNTQPQNQTNTSPADIASLPSRNHVSRNAICYGAFRAATPRYDAHTSNAAQSRTPNKQPDTNTLCRQTLRTAASTHAALTTTPPPQPPLAPTDPGARSVGAFTLRPPFYSIPSSPSQPPTPTHKPTHPVYHYTVRATRLNIPRESNYQEFLIAPNITDSAQEC